MSFEKERRTNRSPMAAALLSFLLPGLGQMYTRRVKSGIFWLVVVVAGYFFFILPGLILHFICVCSAYCLASSAPRPLAAGLLISVFLFAIWFAIVYHTLPSEVQKSISFFTGILKKSDESGRENRLTVTWNGKERNLDENEEKAIEALLKILDAEEAYKKKYGRYTYKFGRLRIMGLSASIILAYIPDSPYEYHGYNFVPVKRHHTGWVNLNSMFVVCAVPGRYKVTGIRTFVMGSAGKVLGKDNGGKPVKNVTDIDRSWTKQ